MDEAHRVAYHEAGHAVACLALGRRLTACWAVSVRGAVQMEPECFPSTARCEKDVVALRKSLAIDVAGAVAEQLAAAKGLIEATETPARLSDVYRRGEGGGGWADDLRCAVCKARGIGYYLHGGPPSQAAVEEQLKIGQLLASVVLQERWEGVERLAAALLRAKWLRAAQVCRLVGGDADPRTAKRRPPLRTVRGDRPV